MTPIQRNLALAAVAGVVVLSAAIPSLIDRAGAQPVPSEVFFDVELRPDGLAVATLEVFPPEAVADVIFESDDAVFRLVSAVDGVWVAEGQLARPVECLEAIAEVYFAGPGGHGGLPAVSAGDSDSDSQADSDSDPDSDSTRKKSSKKKKTEKSKKSKKKSARAPEPPTNDPAPPQTDPGPPGNPGVPASGFTLRLLGVDCPSDCGSTL